MFSLVSDKNEAVKTEGEKLVKIRLLLGFASR